MSGVRKHLLGVGEAVVRRLLAPAQVRLERLHPGDDQQRRGVARRRDQRERRQALVVALLEEGEELLADLVGGHRHGTVQSSRAAIVPQPTTTSPRSRHAVWPGRGAVDGLEQLELDAGRGRARPPRGTARARAVAQLDARRPRPRRGAAARRAARPRGGERLARAGDDAVRTHVGGEHVQRLGRGDAEALALADREVVRAAVAARARRRRGRRSRPGGRRARRGGPGTRPCRCRPGSTGPATRPWRRPAARPRRPARAPAAWSARRAGSAAARASPGVDRGEHVGLVLGRVGGGAQQPVLRHARVVAGGERRPRRAGRRRRPSRRGARGRCSPRTGSASRRPRSPARNGSTTPARNSARAGRA